MSLLRRALTGATATVVIAAGLLVGATPASAIDSDYCPAADSTRLLTANGGEYKLWVWQTANSQGWTETQICFAAGDVIAGDLIIRHPVQGVPTVTPTLDDQDCVHLLDIQDPVQLLIQLGYALSGNPVYVCVGAGDQAYRIELIMPDPFLTPAVVLYLDRHTLVGDAFCANAPANPYCTLDYIRIPIV